MKMMRKLISRCKVCDGITFMAVYDTPKEILSAYASIKQLEKEGREIDIIRHTESDPAPAWCNCSRKEIP